MSEKETIIGIPGPWKERSDLIERIAITTKGEFMWAGLLLMNSKDKDHVTAELYDADPHMRNAFKIAGHGRLSETTLDEIGNHLSTLYLHFPLAVSGQQQRLKMFTGVIKDVGGIALKIETSGVAHSWESWEEILNSDNPFDMYRGFVTLVGDQDHYYSCGMHHFSLPEVQVSRSLEIEDAADLINRFNYYRLVENPKLDSGHSFSLSPDAPHYRLNLIKDQRHDPDELFHNSFGVWDCRKA